MTDKRPTILHMHDVADVLHSMTLLDPCGECQSAPALVLDGDDQGEVILGHQAWCPNVQAKRAASTIR